MCFVCNILESVAIGRDAPDGNFAGYGIPDGTGWHQLSGGRIPDTGYRIIRGKKKINKKNKINKPNRIFRVKNKKNKKK